jgi:hypothetical protein
MLYIIFYFFHKSLAVNKFPTKYSKQLPRQKGNILAPQKIGPCQERYYFFTKDVNILA